MPDHDDERPSTPGTEGAFAGGCVLLLVLVADVAAALLIAVVLAVRGLHRMDSGSGQTAAGGGSQDWTPVLGFGVLSLVVGVTAVVLLRIEHRVTGVVQMVLCVLVALVALASWP
ncbi:inner-membrane translocator [Streptomyces sp. NPDC057682]|uniref:inner-membrane translocator n=1 Tax=Streptomyces sp. NPDC057682 TaxID=3346210 RepID=UPI0036B5695A